MPTVLINLSGPMQAWGTSSRWEERSTGPRPTLSGVLGMVANALGMDAGDDLGDLTQLRFAVRADRPGHLEEDQQTAGGGSFPIDPLTALTVRPEDFRYGVPRKPVMGPDSTLSAPWTEAERTTVVITKHYNVDAAFLAGLTGPEEVVEQVHAALQRPARTLFLGRRSCPLTAPPAHGLVPLDEHAWPVMTPLLRNATQTNPMVYTQVAAGTAGATSTPEAPDAPYSTRTYRGLHTTRTRVTPPPYQPDEEDVAA